MKDLKNAIKEAGLKADFGLTEIGKFDPLCSGCAYGCVAGRLHGCTCGCPIGSAKYWPE